jgi:DNA-binding beta-propeller fold protein YncE
MTFAAATQGRTFFVRLQFALSLCAMFSVASVTPAEVVVETVLSDLHRPRGIAVRPGGTADRFEIFVADTGAGRIVRWSNQSPKEKSEVISGFAAGNTADASTQTGPMAVGFFDPGLLVVGTTQGKVGSLLRAYELQEGENVLAADAASEATSKFSRMNGATCTSFARARVNELVPDRLFLAVRGDDTVRSDSGDARLWSARVQSGTIREPKPFGSEEPAESRAVAISNSGRVVAADAGGKLTFYSPVNGDVELALATDLKQPLSLAYNPSTGALYAADFARGIYRIDDASQPGSPACRTVKVADANRPTALAFVPDGALYVLTFGTSEDNGTLSIITGDL